MPMCLYCDFQPVSVSDLILHMACVCEGYSYLLAADREMEYYLSTRPFAFGDDS